jgi:hypothetical protein
VVVVLPLFLRIAFVVIAPFPPPPLFIKLRALCNFFLTSLVPFVRVRVSASFSNEEEDVVVVKEEIKRSFLLLLLLLLRAENTPSLSLSRNDDDTKTFRAFRESV